MFCRASKKHRTIRSVLDIIGHQNLLVKSELTFYQFISNEARKGNEFSLK